MFPRSLPSLPSHVANGTNHNSRVTAEENSQSGQFVEHNAHAEEHCVIARPLPKPKVRQKHKKLAEHDLKEKHESVIYDTSDVACTRKARKQFSRPHSNTSDEKSEQRIDQSAEITKNIDMSVLGRLKNKRRTVAEKEMRHKGDDKNETLATASTPHDQTLLVLNPNLLKGNIVSHPVGKIFVEEERGFREVNGVFFTTECEQNSIARTTDPSNGIELAVNLAVRTQKFFHAFSTWCHGLLAGMALWQCITVYQLGLPHFETFDFVAHYSILSQPVQTLFYFFFVICTVSAFDRYDIGNPQWFNCKCILSCRTGVVIILIYPASLLISLSIANIDDKLSLHSYNSSLWLENNVEDVNHELSYWKTLNLGRCIGAVLGWIIIALQPNIDSFLHRLEGIENLSHIKTSANMITE